MSESAERRPQGQVPQGQVVELAGLPSLPKLYLNAAAITGRRRLPGRGPERTTQATLPAAAHAVRGIRIDVDRLSAYQHLMGEPARDSVPAGYVHALAFPVAMSLMTRADFPLPLLGMIHLQNNVRALRPVSCAETLDVTAWAENLRAHRRGSQVDMVTEVSSDGKLVWRGVSSYLAKGISVLGSEADRPDGDGDRASGAEAPGEASRPHGEFVPPVPTALWRLGADVGRAYAGVSGDFNPIHLSALSAKVLGMRSSIAHGMYLASRALAEIGPGQPEAFDWRIRFEAPVRLPGRVALQIADANHGGHPGKTFVGWNPRSLRRNFSGAVTAL